MPPNTVKVDRSTRWGNPFKVGMDPMPAMRLLSSVMGSQSRAFEVWFDGPLDKGKAIECFGL